MTVNLNGFPQVMPDNETVYYSTLLGIIETTDNDATVALIRTPSGVLIRIFPSIAKYTASLLRAIKDINSTFGIKVEFSKSIKTSYNIVYKISI